MGRGGEVERRTLGQAVLQAAVLTVVMLLSLSCYLAVLWWRGPHATIVTQTRWDEAIPFQPAWVWVYLFPYALAPFLGASLTRDTFWWYIRRGLVVVAVSLVIFVLLPTKTAPHRITDVGSGPTADLYRSMAQADGPAANAAPSLHVSLTCLLAWALLRDFPRWRAVIVVSVGVVWLSTLLTWQHHLIDVLTGALLGSLAAVWPRPGKGSGLAR
jgi:membrane-associated phospholipid phosphatase